MSAHPHPRQSSGSGPRPSVALHLVAKDGRAVGTQGCCRECGHPFVAKRATKEFCGLACRRAYNNRKAVRGALIYDLLMTWRFDRSDGKDAAARALLGQAAALFKEEDNRERAGRRSWDDLPKWRERNTRIAAKVVGVNVAGNRRRP